MTGALHMGHALNGAIQDSLIRLNRMRGRNTLWALGTDHAGIATQAVVERELARARGSRATRSGAKRSSSGSGSGRRSTGRRSSSSTSASGPSCDYERERFTLDERYVRAVYRVFKALYERGLIYRDNYMVNWDPGSRSAISDLEVEDREVEDVALRDRLSGRELRAGAHRRHGPPRDDARRHRGRRPPGRRALPRPGRRALRPAAGRPAARRSSPTSTSIPSSEPGR